ncbi:MAG: protoporphyrinogen oxidase [Candidatus Eisenbacteria bacterium]|uniref:Coproporphyrinogen III oxidase n=1 Tax=Eiseniibacteriota bacterium TaxID=2212470 RepID=A0A538U5L8_UNCEI|nr:MAG: protoporphyrinogen oxidase [Candidatus Eisenbacteria bacterium]
MTGSRFVVIGGGITGLTAAYRLRERAPRGTEVILLEGSDRLGGHAHTVTDGGFVVEAGPNGFLSRAAEPEPIALIRDLGLAGSLVEARPAARRRFVVHGGRMRRVPDSPPVFFGSDALSPAGKLRLLLEPFARRAPKSEETVYEFACRRVGREAAEVLVDTAISGISAGDSRELSVAAAFPLMTEMEREHGSLIRAMIARRQPPPRLVSLAGGMGELVATFAARLSGVARTGARVKRLERAGDGWQLRLEDGEALAADGVLLAAPAARAAAMVADLDPELSRGLAEFPYAGLGVVAMAFRAADLTVPLDGYGYLVARREGLDTLGVVWDSSLFAGRAPEGMVLVRAMLGGARRPEVADLGEDEILRRARAELKRVLGVTAAPARSWVWRWPRAIPQYTRGHRERVAAVRARAARHPGLELCGTSYDGIAFGAGVISAERAVARVLAGAGVAGAAAAEGGRGGQGADARAVGSAFLASPPSSSAAFAGPSLRPPADPRVHALPAAPACGDGVGCEAADGARA